MDNLNPEDYYEISVAINFTRMYWDNLSRNHTDEAQRSLGRVKVIVLDGVQKKIEAAMIRSSRNGN